MSIARGDSSISLQEYCAENGFKYPAGIICARSCFLVCARVFLQHVFPRLSYSYYSQDTAAESLDEIIAQYPEHKEHFTDLRYLHSTVQGIAEGVGRYAGYVNGRRRLRTDSQSRTFELGVPRLRVIDGNPRYSSTFEMLQDFVENRTIVDELTLKGVQDGTQEFDDNGSEVETRVLADFEWEHLTNVRDILKIFQSYIQMLEKSQFESFSSTLTVVCRLFLRLQLLDSKFPETKDSFICLGLSKATEQLLLLFPINNVEITSLLPYCLATILDPKYKLEMFRKSRIFPEVFVAKLKQKFQGVYDSYRVNHNSEGDQNSMELDQGETSVSESAEPVFFSEEIERYLFEPCAPKRADVREYYRKHREKYPILYQMARDYFAIPAMSSTSKETGYQMGEVVTAGREPRTMENLGVFRARKSRNHMEDE